MMLIKHYRGNKMKLKKLLESIERESKQPKINETKKAFFNAIREFSSTTNEVYSSRKLKELSKKIGSLAEMAERITLSETDGWFDQVSVKRDMKSIKEAAKIFSQTCEEMSTLQQRLESAYEDVGVKLGKYYDLSEAMDPVGQEDGDIDNDGDEDETDEYLANRRKAISKAIKNESVKASDLSSVSKARATSELKQKIKGKRADGLGEYTGAIYGIDDSGEAHEIRTIDSINKYKRFGLGESRLNESQFMSKPEINKVLKGLGFGLIKMKINMYQSKTYPSKQQGIRGGSVGPMTATSAHLNHNREALNKVKDKLESIGGRVEETRADLTVAFPSKKGELVYNFLWSLYPTYAGNDYDPSYKTYWLTYTVAERKPAAKV